VSRQQSKNDAGTIAHRLKGLAEQVTGARVFAGPAHRVTGSAGADEQVARQDRSAFVGDLHSTFCREDSAFAARCSAPEGLRDRFERPTAVTQIHDLLPNLIHRYPVRHLRIDQYAGSRVQLPETDRGWGM